MHAPGTLPGGAGETRRRRLAVARLYLICTATPGGRELERVLPDAIAGGVDIVQLRDKGLAQSDLTRVAERACRLCQELGALFIVNDHPQIAIKVQADGVHVGQGDLPPAAVRELIGGEALLGLSTHTPQQVDAAAAAGEGPAGVDYIGVGPVFATPTKPGRRPVGTDLVRHAAASRQLPFFAIGGIEAENVMSVLGAGARRVAVVRAIADADDPMRAARQLREALDHQLVEHSARAEPSRTAA